MKNTKTLTKGNMNQQLIALAIPLIIGNILQQFYNTIDSFIIGRYISSTAFAAVGVAGSVMSLLIFIIHGGCNGISIIFAELYGEKNWKDLKKESFISFSFGLLSTIVLSIIGLLCLNPLLQIIQTPRDVAIFAYDYLWVIYVGLPATFLYNWCSAVLRAVGDTKTPLWILCIAMIMNLGLDYILVVDIHMGISGAAFATVISQLFSALVCLLFMRLKYRYLLFQRHDMLIDAQLLFKTTRFGVVSALHQSSLYIGKLFVQGAVNTAGTEVISAYTTTMRIEGFANSFGDSGSAALSVFIAQNNGAKNKERVHQGLQKGLKIMFILGACLSVIMVFITPYAVTLFIGKTSSNMINHVQSYMNIISLFYILCFIGNTFVGLYRGLGYVHIPVLGTLLHISIRVILSYLLINSMGLSAVALATGIGWGTVVIFQWVIYKKDIL